MAFLGLQTFLSPFAHTQTILEVSFYLALFGACEVARRGDRLVFQTPLLLPFVLFGAWAAVSVVFALDVRDSLSDFYAHYLKYLILYLLLFNFFRSRQRLVWLAWIFTVSGAVLSASMMVYYYGIRGEPLTTRLALDLTYYSVNQLGFTTVLSALLAWQQLRSARQGALRAVAAFCCVVSVAASLLSQSRGTVLALAVSFVVLNFRNVKVLVALVLLFALFLTAKPVQERISTSADRIGLILYSTEIVKDYPLFGTGFSIDTFHNHHLIDPDKYKARIPERYRDVVPFLWPHNMLLSVAVRTGVLGVLLFIFLHGVLARTAWQLLRFGGDCFIRGWGQCSLSLWLMFVVKGMVEPAFFHGGDVVFYSICAMVTILWWLNRQATAGTASVAIPAAGGPAP